jgi:hypothetical protein
MPRDVSHTREGDMLINNETRDVYKVAKYQWTFCAKCSESMWMNFCEETKNPKSLHYRYYVLENIRNEKQFEVSGEYLDNALRENRIKFTTYHKGYYK